MDSRQEKTRSEKARREEDDRLDSYLSDLAELSHTGSAKKKPDVRENETLIEPSPTVSGAGRRSNPDLNLEDRKPDASKTPYSSKA